MITGNYKLVTVNLEGQSPHSGGHSKLEPPGPIPNPEVKRLCADGSWTIGPVRVGRRQFYMPCIS